MNTAAPAPAQDLRRAPASPIEAARGLLARHVHFRGRVDHFIFEAEGDALIVEGAVPSFYLKQLLQTLLRETHGIARIVNRVEVICPGGISSCSEQTRQRCALDYKLLGEAPLCFPTCDRVFGDDASGSWSSERAGLLCPAMQ